MTSGRWAGADASRIAATLPSGSQPLLNPTGGIPGFRTERVFVLPGPTDEMKAVAATIRLPIGGTALVTGRSVWVATYDQVQHLIQAFSGVFPYVELTTSVDMAADPPRVGFTFASGSSTSLEIAQNWLASGLAAAGALELPS
jgi:hypothetical protein